MIACVGVQEQQMKGAHGALRRARNAMKRMWNTARVESRNSEKEWEATLGSWKDRDSVIQDVQQAREWAEADLAEQTEAYQSCLGR